MHAVRPDFREHRRAGFFFFALALFLRSEMDFTVKGLESMILAQKEVSNAESVSIRDKRKYKQSSFFLAIRHSFFRCDSFATFQRSISSLIWNPDEWFSHFYNFELFHDARSMNNVIFWKIAKRKRVNRDILRLS